MEWSRLQMLHEPGQIGWPSWTLLQCCLHPLAVMELYVVTQVQPL